MIGDSLTLENLTAIYKAMSKIKETDRSEYFNHHERDAIEPRAQGDGNEAAKNGKTACANNCKASDNHRIT